jgi:hypothetical protein
MSEKVTLPREVAEAIDAAREAGKGDNRLIQVACSAERILYDYDRAIYEWCRDDNLIRFVGALVNGYEVEQTPEDKVRELYQSVEIALDRIFDPKDREQIRLSGYQDGITDTLDVLGIKISGVNAE